MELVFESEIAEYLNGHGWLYSPDDTGYDKELALFPEDVLGWLADTGGGAIAIDGWCPKVDETDRTQDERPETETLLVGPLQR